VYQVYISDENRESLMETLVKDVGARSGVAPREAGKEKEVIQKDGDSMRRQGVLGFLERENCPPACLESSSCGLYSPFLSFFFASKESGCFRHKNTWPFHIII
jgi:hypothetical protein